jgi:ribosomal protein S11
MLTLQTIAIISSTYNNTTLLITLMQMYTIIDKLIGDAIYIEKKAINL